MLDERQLCSDSVKKPGADPIVDVRNLGFSYQGHPALENLTFSVEENRIFAFLGPNGGGKTTLFLVLCTLLPPGEGEARVAGASVENEPKEVRYQIGVVFQSNSSDIELTAKENLISQGHLYGLRGERLRERVEDLLARFGLQDRGKSLVKTLSGGLRRRLELAKGLLHNPRVLLLDEPTSGLDPGGRRDFWKYLQMLRDQEEMTILLTTHLMEEAEKCDQLAILNRGRLVAIGSPAALKKGIGGDVIVVQTRQPERLCELIGGRFDCTPTVVDGTVRLELAQGHQFVPKLIESFPGQIEAVTVGRPTLEDVFIHETGHRFWVEDLEGNLSAGSHSKEQPS